MYIVNTRGEYIYNESIFLTAKLSTLWLFSFVEKRQWGDVQLKSALCSPEDLHTSRRPQEGHAKPEETHTGQFNTAP